MPSKTKPQSPRQLAEFEAGRDLGAELMQSIREMKAGRVRVVHTPATAARLDTGLSRTGFAALCGVSARTLLTVARTHPQALLAAAGVR